MPDKKAATKPQIIIRKPESIYQIKGDIDNGTFRGRWHFFLYQLKAMLNCFSSMFCSE